MKTIFKAITAALLLSTLLGGCAVYGPPPYAQSGPVYMQPPVSFGFNFGYWGGGGGRGWGGGGHHR